MYVSIDKLLTKKIYYDTNVVLKNNSVNKVNVIFTDSILFDNFEKTFDQIYFIPDNNVNLFYPKKYYSLITNDLVSKVQDKNDFFKELNSRKLKKKFHKVEELEEVKNLNDKHLVVNLSKVQSDISDYLSKHNKNYKDGFIFINNLIKNYLDKDTPKDKSRNIFFTITQPTDIFVKYFDYGIRKDFSTISSTFKNSKVFLINPYNKLIFCIDLINAKVNINTANMINKFIQLVNKFDKEKILNNPELEVLKSDLNQDELDALPEITSNIEDSEGNNIKSLSSKDVDSIQELKIKADLEAEKDPLSDKVENITDVDFDELTDKNVINEIDKVKKDNEEFLKKMLPYQEKILKDFELLAEKQSKDKTLDSQEIKDTTIINDNMKSSKLNSISLSYYKKQYLKDMLEILKSLNKDPDYPVVITKLEITNKNDSLNLQDEISVQFLDKKGKRHSFTVYMPKLSQDGYLYYNGSKKFITKQSTLLPVIKESNERVQITTNYKKSFLYRKGDKINVTVDKALRLLFNKNYPSIKKAYGNSSVSNINYNVSIAYNYLSSKFYSIDINTVSLIFNQKYFKQYFDSKNINFDYSKYTPIGFDAQKINLIVEDVSTRKIYFMNLKTLKLGIEQSNSLTEYLDKLILTTNNEEILNDYRALNNSKSLAYSEIRIAGVGVNVGVLIAYYKGLLTALDIAKIKYSTEEKRRRAFVNETMLEFKDVYLYINSEGNAAKELFINGLTYLNSKEYNLEDTDKNGIIYLEYFNDFTGSRNNAKALNNFEYSMIDPITLEILKDLNLPETFPELIVYANNLLGDYNRKRKNDMSNFRMRGTEVLNVALYNVLINAFNNYKRTAKTGMTASISPNSKDAVMKSLSENPNVEGYSILNPFFEIEMMAKTSYKGPSGLKVVHFKLS